MTDQVKRAAGVVVLALVLLLLGLLSGRDEAAGSAIFGAGLILLLAGLVAVGLVLIRGDRKAKTRD